ncbi:tetratricopeptide repeat protein [Massilia sp. RP-1-19]|uniref:Tetratricopeptide repeat protein n=1 Tax=Massilia polaris TaxID=2728846 RepID=A0A848HP52_9BURK|nr:tetratricopeptide repeat protein [Massilia polaris]NML60328.1 tetratricopeptide repeat protein [Massilia polaris]
MAILHRRLAILLIATAGAAQAAPYCGELDNAYGPFDYRTRADKLNVVETYHFTDEVKHGIGRSYTSIGSNLDYTLRAFPNHAPALAVMAKTGLLKKKYKVPGAKYAVECYFERAVRFAPDDGQARAAYGGYLYGMGRLDEALARYDEAVQLMPNDAAVNYNAGLLYFKKKNYEAANRLAQKAYSLGFPLPGLKNMLVSSGKWQPLPETADKPETTTPAETTEPLESAAAE